jgi:hypothetical protein
MAWASIDDLEDWLGVPADTRMQSALDVSLAWCNRMRPDLDPDGIVGDDIRQAVIAYGALLFRERTSPQGFATYAELGAVDVDPSSAMINVYRLLGTRRPVAR